ncbi:methylaspartate ammonia-lyase [Rhizobium sp. 007]|uniref:methylaspartate ammonia-lyase n=1 Tax=Rhizobium sp. 007 TaxID=2785056 RepID=UPI00188F2DE7|nr:methylaspartate ammonia-lyase [Rhizobium sp. 007]QPB24483.1 methylaspartate ammonia-lyase [Rhizobium sp. 007]
MKISDVIFPTGQSAYFHIDFAAVRLGRVVDGFTYKGPVATPHFSTIAEPAKTISVVLVLEDGQVAFGDCTDVVYSGVYGRDPIFLPSMHLDRLNGEVAGMLRGRDISSFKTVAEEFDAHDSRGTKLHIAVRYGITQALLHAVSLIGRETMAEVVAREYETGISTTPIPILSTGELDDPKQLDRMILKRVDLLPHSYYQNAQQQLTAGAENLFEYIRYVASRILAIGDPGYQPRIVVDMGGTLGDLFSNNVSAIVACLGRASEAAKPFDLVIEGPVTGATRDEHLTLFHEIRVQLRAAGINVPIIADEWCNTFDDIKALIAADASDFVQIKMPDLGGINNTIEAVLYCKEHRMGAFLGGSYNETDQSARVSTHIALATQPDFMVAKPGRGGDEALMIQRNEMSRSIALMHHRSIGNLSRGRLG